MRPPAASSGRTSVGEQRPSSGLRQSWETLIVTRSRNGRAPAVAPQERAYSARRRGRASRRSADPSLHLAALVLQQVDRGTGRPAAQKSGYSSGGGRGRRRLARSHRGGHLVEPVDGVRQAGLGDRARHPVDGAGRSSCDEHVPPAARHRAGPVEPVAAHAGQDDEDEVGGRTAARRRRSSGPRAGAARPPGSSSLRRTRRPRRGAGACRRARAAPRRGEGVPSDASRTPSRDARSSRCRERSGEARRHVLDDDRARPDPRRQGGSTGQRGGPRWSRR